MRILLVSHSILPYKGGTSVIVENLASNFSPSEMIVVGSKKLVHPKTKSRPNFHYFFSELTVFGRGARFFNWFRKWRFEPLKRYIKKIALDHQIDYVVGVYPNSFYCLAACQVAKDLNLPFSSYFHNTYVENAAINEPDAEEIQKEIFDYSENIFVMSKGMQHFYEQKYGLRKFVPLVHTFSEYPNLHEFSALEKKKVYELVAIGNFNESNLDATKRFVNAISSSNKFSLNLYTHVPKALLQQRGVNLKNIKHLGFIAPDQIHDALQEFDICVLTHGFEGGYGEIEYQTIFPTRTIPFLLSGKPIIAHSPENSFLTQFLTEHNCAKLVTHKDEKAILEALEELIDNIDLQKKLYKNAKKTVKMFYGPEVANFLKSKLKGENSI